MVRVVVTKADGLRADIDRVDAAKGHGGEHVPVGQLERHALDGRRARGRGRLRCGEGPDESGEEKCSEAAHDDALTSMTVVIAQAHSAKKV